MLPACGCEVPHCFLPVGVKCLTVSCLWVWSALLSPTCGYEVHYCLLPVGVQRITVSCCGWEVPYCFLPVGVKGPTASSSCCSNFLYPQTMSQSEHFSLELLSSGCFITESEITSTVNVKSLAFTLGGHSRPSRLLPHPRDKSSIPSIDDSWQSFREIDLCLSPTGSVSVETEL